MSMPNKNDLSLIAKNVESCLKSFNKKKAEFKALKADAAGIRIASVDDTVAIKAAGIMRKRLKAARCEVARQGKEIRQPLTNLAFMISEKEKELIAIIEQAERELQNQESWVESERERIANEEREKIVALLNDRINKLAAFGFSVDTETLASLDDETFAAVLDQARAQYEIDQAQPTAPAVDDLHDRIDAIMNDERKKADGDDRSVMVNLNAMFSQTINSNPILFEERKRLMMYAKEIDLLLTHHAPAMQTADGRDIIATANDAIRQVYQMLLQSVDAI